MLSAMPDDGQQRRCSCPQHVAWQRLQHSVGLLGAHSPYTQVAHVVLPSVRTATAELSAACMQCRASGCQLWEEHVLLLLKDWELTKDARHSGRVREVDPGPSCQALAGLDSLLGRLPSSSMCSAGLVFRWCSCRLC